MGRWCEVKCNCPNRKPVLGSMYSSYSEYCKYLKKPRLAKTREEWQAKVENMYECGHKDGAVIQFAPSDLLRISCALAHTYKKQPTQFEMFRKIDLPENYEDEHLAFSKDDVALWRMEIEQLRRYLSAEEFMGFRERETFEKELSEHESLYDDTQETLEKGLLLCEASIKTGNPIEFLW